jgi:hypothetical protein
MCLQLYTVVTFVGRSARHQLVYTQARFRIAVVSHNAGVVWKEFIYWSSVECWGLNVEGEGKKSRVECRLLNVEGNMSRVKCRILHVEGEKITKKYYIKVR